MVRDIDRDRCVRRRPGHRSAVCKALNIDVIAEGHWKALAELCLVARYGSPSVPGLPVPQAPLLEQLPAVTWPSG